GGARRKDRQVGAALALHSELAVLDRRADLVVAHPRARRRWLAGPVRRDLFVAPALVLARGGRVVTVAIDDHRALLLSGSDPLPARDRLRGEGKGEGQASETVGLRCRGG